MQRQFFSHESYVLLFGFASAAQQEVDPERSWLATEAVVLWLGLAIVAVVILGIGLMWAVSRGAKLVMKKREPTHTEMKNIWYLNPPEKRKRDDP